MKIKKIPVALLLCFVFSLSLAQRPHTNIYMVKKTKEAPCLIKSYELEGVEVIELDNILRKKGYNLLKTDNFNTLQKIENIEYISPVYITDSHKVITYSNEIFVAFAKTPDKHYINYLEEKYNILYEAPFQSLPLVHKFIIENNISTDVILLAQDISRETHVRYSQPNYMFTPAVNTVDDPHFPRQWALQNNGTPIQFNGTPGADMKVVEAWDITKGHPDIKIAILDSGVDTLHPDLMDNLLPGFDATGDGSQGYPNKNYSSDAHGTACAGIVAAVADNGIGMAGVAPLCKIIPIKLFYYVQLGGQVLPWSTSEWMADAITWAWQEADADILSNSWGVPDDLISLFPDQDSVVNEAIYIALDMGRNGKGVSMLFSSGNDGGLPIWPSRLPGVIAVNATSMCDERKHPASCDGAPWEGNWGETLNVGAPGVRIFATDITGYFGYGSGHYTASFAGTSAACPNAAGVMALILSVNPKLSAAMAKYVLESTCDKVGGYDYTIEKESGMWSLELGYGRVNAKSAVLKAESLIEPEIKVDNYFYVYHQAENGNHIAVLYLENSANVKLEVFDILGKAIFALPQKPLDSGMHHLTINTQLKQGIYFARLTVGGKARTIKFLSSGI